MKNIKIIGVLFLIISGWTLSAQQTADPLNSLVQQAVKVNPKLNMLQQKMKAARENIHVGTHFADPVVSLGLLNVPTNTFSLNQEAMTGKVINLSQAIPYPGALKAKADVKAMDTLLIKEQISDLKNQIIQQVSTLYFGLQETRREMVLAHESSDLLRQISLVAKRKFEVGTASLQNIISVEVELTRVNDKIEALKGEENELQAQLNALLLRNDKTEVATAAISSIPQSSPTSTKLLKEAEKSRPYLQGIRLLERKTSLQQKEARFAFYPNFKVGIQYSQRSFNRTTGINYPDFLGVVVGLNIPINYGGKKTAKINKYRYLQDFYKQQYQSSIQQLQQSFGKYSATLQTLKSREYLVSKTLLPQAEKAYQAAMADYQVNKIDFANVVKAEADILKIKTELAKIRTNYFKTLAQLEFLSGTKLIGK